jgi:hypothetical protein
LNPDGTPATVWTELQGLSSNSLETTVTKSGLTISTAYEVRYRARNRFGWSISESDTTTISTITEPSLIDVSTVALSVVGANVVVNWDAPNANGSPVLKYEVVFAASAAGDAAFVQEKEHCGDTTSVSECTIPMSSFWLQTASTDLLLVAGDAIKLRLRAWNAFAAGPWTATVDSGVLV